MRSMMMLVAGGLFLAGSAQAGGYYGYYYNPQPQPQPQPDPEPDGFDCVKFKLKGDGGLKQGYTIEAEEGGYEVDVYAKAENYDGDLIDAKVGQWSTGMGVIHPDNDGDHEVDGTGYKDILYFDFGTEVKIGKIRFSYVDSGDDVDFVDVLNNIFTDPIYTLEDVNIGSDNSIDLSVTSLMTDVLGIKAHGKYDDFKVKSIEVCYPDTIVVPTPTAAGLGLLGVVGLAVRRRRAA